MRPTVLALACCAAAAYSSGTAPASGETVSPRLSEYVEMRSIDGLTVSPDGAWLAFRVLSPSISLNRVEEQWFVVSVAGNQESKAVGPAAEPIWLPIFDMPDGPTREWAPDSSQFYVLRQQNDEQQVFALGLDGRSRQVTHDSADVVSFRLDRSAGRLFYSVAAPRAQVARAQELEELQGVRLDRSVNTEGYRLTRNHYIGRRNVTMRRTSGASAVLGFAGPVREVRSSEALAPGASVSNDVIFTDSDKKRYRTISGRKWSYRLTELPGTVDQAPFANVSLEGWVAGRDPVACRASFCRGLTAEVREVTVNSQTDEAIVVYEKDFLPHDKIFAWDPRHSRSRLIYDSEGFLSGGSGIERSVCPRSGRYLLCVEARPSIPPRLVRIDLNNGEMRVLHDPNFQVARPSLSKSSFLRWKDASGRSASGVLTVPTDGAPPYPLVLTTYRCAGFLNGGTGRLTPEGILAQYGIASLCVGLNNAIPIDRKPGGQQMPLARIKATSMAYAAGVELLVRQGVADRSRVGITGHSFSGNVVAYAISQSNMYRVAVSGGGTTIDPVSYFMAAPTADSWRKDVPTVMGLPAPTDDSQHEWEKVSPALNASRIRTPLLMLPPENEYLFALQLYTAIADSGSPVEMYIYPDAGHLFGRQPAQLYWRSRRALDWIAFWLLGRAPEEDAAGTVRSTWEAMRSAHDRLRIGTRGAEGVTNLPHPEPIVAEKSRLAN